jgi:hypothetical protein
MDGIVRFRCLKLRWGQGLGPPVARHFLHPLAAAALGRLLTSSQGTLISSASFSMAPPQAF